MLVSDIIRSALSQLGVIPIGESYPASWDTDWLRELNAMLQNWASEGLNLHVLTTSTPKTLTVGDPSYTIGSSGDINNRRPVEIVAAKVALSGSDYPLKVSNSILDYVPYMTKTAQGQPTHLFYDADYASALATIWLYPSPSDAYVMTLYSLTSLAPVATTAKTIALPPEYEWALSANLAAHLMASYGKTDASLVKKAQETKAALKANNVKRLLRTATFDAALVYDSHGLWNIQTG